MSSERYPSHNGTELWRVDVPGSRALHVCPVMTCIAPLVPPECAGSAVREEGASWPGKCLFCVSCGIVDATPEQVEQARAAAVADGTWPG